LEDPPCRTVGDWAAGVGEFRWGVERQRQPHFVRRRIVQDDTDAVERKERTKMPGKVIEQIADGVVAADLGGETDEPFLRAAGAGGIVGHRRAADASSSPGPTKSSDDRHVTK
jgi:hypothetical protein